MGKLANRTASLTAALTVSLAGLAAPAIAEEQDQPQLPVEQLVNQPLSDAEYADAEEALEELFTTIIQEGRRGWTVDETAAENAGISIEQAQQIAEALNAKTSRRVPRHAVNSEEYKRCVLNAVGLGGLTASAAGGGSQLGYLIATQNWKEVAWVLGRLVGVNALKGGVAGATAALAGAGAWCATPWAS